MSGLSKNTMILGGIGILLIIVGIGIVNIHGNPLRGSGLGTVSIIAGVVLGGVAVRRMVK